MKNNYPKPCVLNWVMQLQKCGKRCISVDITAMPHFPKSAMLQFSCLSTSLRPKTLREFILYPRQTRFTSSSSKERRGKLSRKRKSRHGARNQFQEPSLELSRQAT
jgi:hypothetical protein